MRVEKRHLIKTLCAYLYLLIGYVYITYNFSYTIRIAAKPEGWALLIIYSLGFFLVYIITNHIFTKKIVAKKLLIVIELSLLVSLFTILWSDLMFENR